LSMPAQPGVTPDPRQAKLSECNNSSMLAANAARQTVKTNDPVGKVDVLVINLLVAPTSPPPAPQPPTGPGGVAPFCSALRSLGGKFPFDPNSRQTATLAEFSGFFQPGTGAISKFLDANKTVFELQGSQYIQSSGKANFAFVINQLVAAQRAFYPGNAAQPQFPFTLKGRVPEGYINEEASINGQVLKASGSSTATQQFAWPGDQSGATLKLNGISFAQYSGLWGAFQFFQDYSWTRTATGYHLEWTPRGQGDRPVQFNGKNVVVEFELESAGVPLFQRGFISGLKCPAGAK